MVIQYVGGLLLQLS